MRPARTGPMPSMQAIRLRLDDVEDLLAEGPQQLLGIDWANAADHSRGEVLLDTLDRRGRRGLEEPGLELLTVSAVVDPVAGSRDPLPGRDHGSMANQANQFAMATGV